MNNVSTRSIKGGGSTSIIIKGDAHKTPLGSNKYLNIYAFGNGYFSLIPLNQIYSFDLTDLISSYDESVVIKIPNSYFSDIVFPGTEYPEAYQQAESYNSSKLNFLPLHIQLRLQPTRLSPPLEDSLSSVVDWVNSAGSISSEGTLVDRINVVSALIVPDVSADGAFCTPTSRSISVEVAYRIN